MSLTVETGAGLSTAESYISVTDATAYHTARGQTTWTGIDAVKEAALRKATAFLEGRYRRRWRGRKATIDQALAWPRIDAVDDDGYLIESDIVPTAVANACAEAARLIIEGVDLNPNLDHGGRVTSETDTVGPISTAKTYSEGAPARIQPTIVDDLIGGLVTPGPSGGTRLLLRA